jgi:protein-tyrosine phosphatase
VLDDGPCRFGQPSSVVQVTGNRFRVLRAGVVPERTLRRLASLIVVLVCTGNTCRSPMAEAIARRLVADRLGCEPPQIEDHGVIVASAGLAAMDGGGATPEAIVAMSERGLDISQHETQPLSETLVRQADYLFTMTRSHREAIVAQWPEAAERAQMLSAAGADVGDPVGGPLERYRRCAEQIEDELRGRVAELPL